MPEAPILRRLEDNGIVPLAVRAIRALGLSSLGFGRGWAVLSIALTALTLLLLYASDAQPAAFLAVSLAGGGIFMCQAGTIAGLNRVLDDMAPLTHVISRPPADLKRDFVEHLKASVAKRRELAGGLLAFLVITPVLYIYHTYATPSNPTNNLRIYALLSYWALISLSAFSIGTAHACLTGALTTSSLIKKHGMGRTFSLYWIYRISYNHFLFTTIALATYICFLLYLSTLSFSFPQTQNGSPALFSGIALIALMVSDGAIVALFYLYPQYVLHIQLKKNKMSFLEEAHDNIESLIGSTEIDPDERRRRLMDSIKYKDAVDKLPVLAFRARDLILILTSYIVPSVVFLKTQATALFP
ncbi:MAG: hypothetical protein GY719_05680 [bacterium]|nr:hypothetical protein [bacterium]